MSESLTSAPSPAIIDYRIFGKQYLNLPALPEHIPLIILSTLLYQFIYSVIAPLLHHLFKTSDPKLPPTPLSRKWWNINIISFSQSLINTSLAIYLLSHPEFRHNLTPQEMVHGYHQETARALAIATGYFCFHLGQTWVHRDIEGNFMLLHAASAIFAISLGFRPLDLHYTSTFLIWELPNLFLNIQRQLDNHGKRNSWARFVNRMLLLSTYAIFRLGMGTVFIIRMGHDLAVTLQDQHPIIRAEYVIPSLRRVGLGQRQEMQKVPPYLAMIQLGSMTLLHFQGFYWFFKIAFKGDWAKQKR